MKRRARREVVIVICETVDEAEIVVLVAVRACRQ